MTLTVDDTTVSVVFCPACAEASGASRTDPQALELAAMRVLRQDLEVRLGNIIGGIGEIVHLLRDRRSPDTLASTGLGPSPDLAAIRGNPPFRPTLPRSPRRLAAGGRRPPIGRRISGAAHTHLTAGLLALDFDEGGERSEARIYRRVSTCGVCREALEELSRWLAVLDHCDPVVGQEFVTRHDFFNRLLADYRSHSERLEVIRSDELLHQWGLCRLLIEESRSCREANPELSAELGELASTVASRLDPGFYRSERVADLCALAAADYGDALRVLPETEAAGRQFEIAREYLKLGTGRTQIASGIARLKARLLKDLGRHDEAHEVLEQAIAGHEEQDQEPRTVLQWILASCAVRSEGELAHGAAQNESR